jgi:hypothetical protein
MNNPELSKSNQRWNSILSTLLAGALTMLLPGVAGAQSKKASAPPPRATPAARPAIPSAGAGPRQGAPATTPRPGGLSFPATRPGTAPGTRPSQPMPGVRPGTTPGPGNPGPGITPGPGTRPGSNPGAGPRTMPGTQPRPDSRIEPGHMPGGNNGVGNRANQPRIAGPAAHPGPGGVFHGPGNMEGKVDPHNGRVKMVSRTETDGSRTVVHNSPTGVRRIENVSHDSFGHSVRTVGDGHRGFRERELLRRPGYRERTYYDHGHAYAYVYHDRTYGRYGAYPVYVPGYYYRPRFYAYFGSPWASAVSFSWGGYPGYGYYGGYFAPPAVYASPNAWMADYIISQNLQATYAAQQDAISDEQASGDPGEVEAQNATPQAIPQDVRDAYTAQVKVVVQQTATEASGAAPPDAAPGALSPDFRVFQTYADVEVQVGGQECALTGGDFVRREEDVPDTSKTVAVTVVTIAKPTSSHCAMNARIRIPVDTLQDWYNSFIESQQAGYEALAANQGKNGFPPMSDTAKVENSAGQATPDDAGVVANAIQQQGVTANGLQAEASGKQ